MKEIQKRIVTLLALVLVSTQVQAGFSQMLTSAGMAAEVFQSVVVSDKTVSGKVSGTKCPGAPCKLDGSKDCCCSATTNNCFDCGDLHLAFLPFDEPAGSSWMVGEIASQFVFSPESTQPDSMFRPPRHEMN